MAAQSRAPLDSYSMFSTTAKPTPPAIPTRNASAGLRKRRPRKTAPSGFISSSTLPLKWLSATRISSDV